MSWILGMPPTDPPANSGAEVATRFSQRRQAMAAHAHAHTHTHPHGARQKRRLPPCHTTRRTPVTVCLPHDPFSSLARLRCTSKHRRRERNGVRARAARRGVFPPFSVCDLPARSRHGHPLGHCSIRPAEEIPRSAKETRRKKTNRQDGQKKSAREVGAGER
jgi:hypothetical protein